MRPGQLTDAALEKVEHDFLLPPRPALDVALLHHPHRHRLLRRLLLTRVDLPQQTRTRRSNLLTHLVLTSHRVPCATHHSSSTLLSPKRWALGTRDDGIDSLGDGRNGGAQLKDVIHGV